MEEKKDTVNEETKKEEKKQEEVKEETKEETSESKLKELESKNKELNDKYLRLLAEYDNFRKRSIKERDGIYADAYVDAIKNILPIIDNFERALTFAHDEKSSKGISMILESVKTTLEKMGVEEIETKVFDPGVHNAVTHIEDEQYGEGEIIEEFQKGYKYKDKILRYAMVKVAN